MKKRITLIVITALVFIFALVEYIKSFIFYSEDGYSGFEFSTDALIILLSAFVLLGLSIYILLSFKNNKDISKEIIISCGAVSGFHACYSLFTILKIVGKAVNKLYDGKDFNLSYQDIAEYIPWFLISTALLVYLIFNYLELKKK